MKRFLTLGLVAVLAVFSLAGCMGIAGPIMLGEAVDDFAYDWIPGDDPPGVNWPSFSANDNADPQHANVAAVHRVTVNDDQNPTCSNKGCARDHRQDVAYKKRFGTPVGDDG